MSGNLNIAILQSNLHWQDKAANLQMFTPQIKSVNQDVHVVILPEMFSTGFSMDTNLLAESMEGETVSWMRTMAMQHKKIIAGSIIICENEKNYNRFIWMLPNGNLHSYDKRHLFAMAGENEKYTAGQTKMIVQVNGFKLLLQICYDLRFPVWNRQSSNAEKYDGIVYIANWPTKRIAHWNTLLTARAIENQCYVVACNRVGQDGNGIAYNGCSQVISPVGEVLQHAVDTECILYASFHKSLITETRAQLPFLQDADTFIIL